MSATNTTTTLGLPIYADADKPSWKDTNSAYQDLDARITALEDLVGVTASGTGLTVAQYAKLALVNPSN